MAKKQIKLTLTRSIHGRLKAHKDCAAGLGLKRLNQTVSVEDNPCVRGMINKIAYMLKVEG
ncbi:MAG: rpmD [Gammaproteobacteria bacterium]|jgi:large subunit ribosomal protein L30|nr:rpmD [Gammaproteobacteria bacterium]